MDKYHLYVPFVDFFARYTIYNDKAIAGFKELIEDGCTKEELVYIEAIIAIMDQVRDVENN